MCVANILPFFALTLNGTENMGEVRAARGPQNFTRTALMLKNPQIVKILKDCEF